MSHAAARRSRYGLLNVFVSATFALALLFGSSAMAQRFPSPWKQPAAERRENVRGPESPSIGAAGAPVTIVTFSDYRCPYCRELSHTLSRLAEEQPDRVRIVYRQFAVLTPESRPLSEAALCADEQGRFAEFHRHITGSRRVSPDDLPQLAGELGLDTDAFRECTQSGRYASRVAEDIREGERLGVEVTPTSFINGVRIVGAPSAEKLRERIAELVPGSAQVRK